MSREPSLRTRSVRTALRRGDPGAGAVLAPEETAAMRRAALAAAAVSSRRRAGRAAGLRLAWPAVLRAHHPSTTARSALKLLAAAAAAAICVVAAVRWQQRQQRPWPRWTRQVGVAGPRPLRQPALAARRPQPDPRGSATGGGGIRAAAAPAPAAGVAAASRGVFRDGRTPRRPGAVRAPPHRARTLIAAGGEPGHVTDEAEATHPPALLARAALAEVGPSVPPRQVQFSLPGGTRVIWLVRGPTSR